MKTKITVLVLLLCAITYGQKKKKKEKLMTYTASNGVEYNVGQMITLNTGSGSSGKFVYVKDRIRRSGFDSERNLLSARFSGTKLKLRAILKINKKNYEGIQFFLTDSWQKPYDMYIENAIKTCEVGDCSNTTNSVVVQESDKYDKLSKLKKLLDQGVLSQEEFDIEKKKVLEGN